MPDYFINTRIQITLDPEYDITEADSVKILYAKPGGSGYWAAEKFGNYIRYTTQTSDIPTAGTWKIQACAVYGSEEKKGQIKYFTLKTPLN